jgi:hypothetical protein
MRLPKELPLQASASWEATPADNQEIMVAEALRKR